MHTCVGSPHISPARLRIGMAGFGNQQKVRTSISFAYRRVIFLRSQLAFCLDALTKLAGITQLQGVVAHATIAVKMVLGGGTAR